MRSLALTVFFVLSCIQGFAANVSLAWDPSPDTNVVRYYVYYGAGSGDYTNRVNADNTTSVTVSNLAVGSAYFFAATAISDDGLESDFSNEVSYTVPASDQAVVIYLSNLEQLFDGASKDVGFSTFPSDVACQVTYDGQLTRPVNAGTYLVVVSTSASGYTGTATGTLVIAKAPATVSLSNLQQVFSGAACTVTATTVPAGLPVTVTYNGSSTAPTAVGNYAVVATVESADYTGTATGTLVIGKAPATVSLANLQQVYSGTACTVTATTVPAGLPVTVTYNGSATAPTAVGNHTVVATVESADYTGTATGALVIGKAPATVSLANLQQVYSSAACTVTAITVPAGLPVTVTYNGSTNAPVDVGNYAVNALINSISYSGSTTGTLVIAAATPIATSHVSLAWDPSPDANVVRYYVYYGVASGDYTNRVDAGNATTATISNLVVGCTYYFAASAVDNSGLESDFSNEVSYTVPAPKQPAMITLTQLEHVYDGQPKTVCAATTPADLAYFVTYNGSTNPPVAPGSYTVVVQVASESYTGATTNILSISQAAAVIALSNLEQVYTGAERTVLVSTTPAGLPMTITYNGNSTAPVMAGSYTVEVTLNSSDYAGTARGTLVVSKAPAQIMLAELAPHYNGSALPVKVSTVPTGLPVEVTYNGGASPPSETGSYTVTAAIVHSNYNGTVTGNLTIRPPSETTDLEIVVTWDPAMELPADQVQVVQATNLVEWVPAIVSEFGTNSVTLVSDTPAGFFRANAGGSPVPIHVRITPRTRGE